jgi:mevalonate kinase
VGDVRRGWLADPARYEAYFAQIGALSQAARQAIEQGATAQLGALFTANQQLLAQLGVSSPQLEKLINAAQQAGAMGGKLSGGGRGGNLIALVSAATAQPVQQALLAAGARSVIQTTVQS